MLTSAFQSIGGMEEVAEVALGVKLDRQKISVHGEKSKAAPNGAAGDLCC
jgi:hypothetical protein